MNNMIILDEQIKSLTALRRIVKRGEVSYRGDSREYDAMELENQLNQYGLDYERHDYKTQIIITIENGEDSEK